MKVETLTLGPLGTNCYLVWVEGDDPTVRKALLVDCAGDQADFMSDFAKSQICVVLTEEKPVFSP